MPLDKTILNMLKNRNLDSFFGEQVVNPSDLNNLSGILEANKYKKAKLSPLQMLQLLKGAY